ncbi:MAG: hypothetical protein NVSMB6_01830 [Burkholderiaceae bacterium]
MAEIIDSDADSVLVDCHPRYAFARQNIANASSRAEPDSALAA